MTIIDRLLSFFRNRRARRAGEAAGGRHAKEVEENWIRMKETAQRYGDNPEALKAVFLGWMHQFHGAERELLAAVEASDAEFQAYWHTIANVFANRFRSEVLTAWNATEAKEILPDSDVERLVTDIEGVVNDFKHGASNERETALDQAVNAIRTAEQAGKLAPDPRSDHELKESIRMMWDAEQDQSVR